jgi:hypothetical protein
MAGKGLSPALYLHHGDNYFWVEAGSWQILIRVSFFRYLSSLLAIDRLCD